MDIDQGNVYNLNHVPEKQKIDPETLKSRRGPLDPCQILHYNNSGPKRKENGLRQPMRCLPKDRKSFWQLLCQEELCG